MGRWLRPAEVNNEAEHSGEESNEVEVPVLSKHLAPLDEVIEEAEFLQVIQTEEEEKLHQGESDGNSGVRTRFCCEVVAPFGQVTILSEAQTSFVHVTQVEHCLGILLLLRCRAVVTRCCLVVDSSTSSIIVSVPEFHLQHQQQRKLVKVGDIRLQKRLP